ncbi:MAG: hypothetical protein FJ125_14535, partial [Deltaproteobacteria bacterium]|nr:hypothetical protein [Deltaproteobacteria bacterium]
MTMPARRSSLDDPLQGTSTLLLFAVLLLASPPAAAQKRAVLLPFSGPGAPAVQQALESTLGTDPRVK